MVFSKALTVEMKFIKTNNSNFILFYLFILDSVSGEHYCDLLNWTPVECIKRYICPLYTGNSSPPPKTCDSTSQSHDESQSDSESQFCDNSLKDINTNTNNNNTTNVVTKIFGNNFTLPDDSLLASDHIPDFYHTCVDQNPKCSLWASQGECHNNPGTSRSSSSSSSSSIIL